MFDATCPRFGLLSPASTADMIVNSAAPMQISMLVRSPEALCRHSRSNPMTAPIAHAINMRVVVPCEKAIWSIVLKWVGSVMSVGSFALRCDGSTLEPLHLPRLEGAGLQSRQ